MKKQFLFLLISFQLVFAPALSLAKEVDQKTADKAKKEGPVEQITAAVAATLGMTIPISCPKLIKSSDTAVYIAGSVAYLGLEVASMVVLRKANKKSQGEVAESDDKNKQLEAIKANKKNFEEARKAAHLRIAALSVFAATSYTAMGLAIEEEIEQTTAKSRKETAKGLKETAQANENIAKGLKESAKITREANQHAAEIAVYPPAIAGFSAAASAAGVVEATQAAVENAQKAIRLNQTALEKEAEADEKRLKAQNEDNYCQLKATSKPSTGGAGEFMNFAKGMAGGLMCMALGFASSDSTWMQGACGLFGLVLGFTQKSFNKIIKKPKNRAIMFGTVAALDTAALGITADKIVKLNDYIKNLDTQIDDQNKTINLGPAVKLGATAGSSGGGNLSASVTPQAFTWNLPDDKNVIPKELRDIEVPTIQMPQGISSPTLTAAVSDIQNMARSVQKGQFSSANVSANNLINNAAKLRKLAQDLEKTYNEKLIASGQEPVNFTQEIEKNMKELQKDLNSAGAGMPSDLLAAASTQNKLDEKNNERKSGSGVETSKAVGMLDAKKGAPSLIFSEEQAGGSEIDTLAMADEMTSENELKNFKVDNADIQKDSGPSIFDVLSVRYLKTAYPTLLKKLK